MADKAAADDPFHAATSATSLLLRTLGPAASAASPSRARGALLGGFRPLQGSKELVEQARLVMEKHGDIQKLYQEDRVRVAAADATIGKTNQQGRRPAMDRKRARFSIKPPSSNMVPIVDFSELENIEDPDEYFATLEQLEKAETEIKKLRGEVPNETVDYNRAIEPSKKRPGMSRRNSVHSYKFSAGADAPDANEPPAPQFGTITEPQYTRDDVPASVPGMTKQPVPSSSTHCAIPDVSVLEDSFAEKDKGASLDDLVSEFKTLDESEEENLLRKKLQLNEISVGEVCLADLLSFPGDRSVSSTTIQKNSVNGNSLERPVSGNHYARISQWEKGIFGGDILKDKYGDVSKDDESDSSPETLEGKRPLVHSLYDAAVITAGEACTARETASPSIKSRENIVEPEPNIPISTDERQPGSSPFGVYKDSDIAKEKDAYSTQNISLEEDDVPLDRPVIEKPNHQAEVSSPHHLEGGATEVSGRTPDINASPLHEEDGNSDHQERVPADDVLPQDKPIHPSEIPTEDIDLQNQSHMLGGTVEKPEVDISKQLSITKESKRKAVRKGKHTKQPSKKGKRLPDEEPLDIPPANFDSEIQPHTQDINIEEANKGNELCQGMANHHSEISPDHIDRRNQSHMHAGNAEKPGEISNKHFRSEDSKQKAVRNGKAKKPPSRRGKKVSDETTHELEIPPPASFDPETQPHMQDTNVEQHAVGASDSQPSNKGMRQKETRRRNRNQESNKRCSLAGAGLTWQSGMRRSTRIRSKPLQHWIGERLLYARVHDTLTTLVGIKTCSPSQDGKAAPKVKSFVPGKHSDLVAAAGKY